MVQKPVNPDSLQITATKKSGFRNILMLITGILLLSYVVIRAYCLSFTHDESLTYTIIIGNSMWKDTANNHILNTKLIWLSNLFFGNSEFALRLPNILAFIVYFFSLFKILKTEKNNYLFTLAVVLLVLNPFLIDFFSLCRGYGISMGFCMLSFSFLLDHSFTNLSEKKFFVNFILIIVFAALAIWPNFSMINYYIICLVLYIVFYFLYLQKNDGTSNRSKLTFVILFLIFLFPLYRFMNRLLLLDDLKQLYFGENTFTAGLNSLLASSMYLAQYPGWILGLLRNSMLFSIPLAIVSILFKRDFFSRFSIITFILVTFIIGLIFENLIFASKYPAERTALFFIPCFGLFLYYFAKHIIEFYNPSKKVYAPFIIIICSLLSLHFLSSANLKYTKTWYYEANTKKVMAMIERQTKELTNNTSISNNWLFEPTINYYILTKHLKLDFATRDGVNKNSHFIYRMDQDSTFKNYNLLLDFKDTNSSLLIKKIE